MIMNRSPLRLMSSGIHTDGTLHDVSISVPSKAESPKKSEKLEGSRPTRHPALGNSTES